MKILNLFLFSWALAASYYCYELKQNHQSVIKEKKIIKTQDLASCAATSFVNEKAQKSAETLRHASLQESSAADEPVLGSSADQEFENYRVNARLSAIEKFVQLNDLQRERLKQKFKLEINKQDAPSLDDILGKDSADFYKQQVSKAYEKSHQEAIDKEVFYLARILSLSTDQEAKVRQVVSDVKGSTDYISHTSDSDSKIGNLQKMLDSVKVQNDLLAEKMKAVLTIDQYQAFIEYQNNSSDSDFTMLHVDPN